MDRDILAAAMVLIAAVGLGVGNGKEVRGDRSAVVLAEFLRDVMTGRAQLRGVTVLQQVLHRLGIGLKDSLVVGLGIRRLGEPPDGVHSVFDADAADIHPFGRRGQLRRIPPVVLLAQVKAEFLDEHDEELEVIKATGRLAGLPSPADVDDKAPAALQDAVKAVSKGPEPVTILIGIFVAIALLRTSPKGGLVMMRSTLPGLALLKR